MESYGDVYNLVRKINIQGGVQVPMLVYAPYFNKVYAEAVELCAYLCKQYTLNPLADGVVICHSEGNKRGIASNHGDVMHWFPRHGKSMDTFRADVKYLLDASQPGKVTGVKLWLGGSEVVVPAENINGQWTVTLPGGTKVTVRDALDALQYGVAWNSDKEMIVAHKKG
jgi:hypothetical protein